MCIPMVFPVRLRSHVQRAIGFLRFGFIAGRDTWRNASANHSCVGNWGIVFLRNAAGLFIL